LDAIPEQYLKKLMATSGNAEFNSEEIPSESCAFLMDLKLRLFMNFGRKPARPQELRSKEQNVIGSTFCRGGKNERFAEVSRKTNGSEFAKNYDSGYEEFKIGVILRDARRKSGLTQEGLARRIRTAKSAISRSENHAEDIKLSTIEKIAKALGEKIAVEIK
jgi:HTH-type transcriptional regulator/antitoxin HipB